MSLSQPNTDLKNSPSSGSQQALCRQFSLAEIKLATDDFNPELVIGTGGHGDVFKGELDNGTTKVAITRLHLGSKGTGFWSEFKILQRFRHPNIISLIGYCNEGQEMILVYEYMAQGTLEEQLYRKITRPGSLRFPISWERRLEICIGAASGLHHLHTNHVIHRDVKSSNILLDEDWIVKISDFGLSKIGSQSKSHISTDFNGTFGYWDPEYYWSGKLTIKSDVYAFGVVLFEVLSGMPAVDRSRARHESQLAIWACKRVKEGKVDRIIDSYLKGKILPACLNAYVEIATNCLHKDGHKRAGMAEIITSLKFALAVQLNTLPSSSNPWSMRRWLKDLFQQAAMSTRLFPLEEIKAATKNFDDSAIIGFGDFGNVYKGHIDNGKQAIMIRQFYGAYGEYAKKIKMLSSLGNVNVACFIGHSPHDESEMFMVYEYLTNGTLHDYLHDPSKDYLPWKRRLQICISAAQGLHYLHVATGEQQTILDQDLKSTNILLDENWVAKVLDFGLSKKDSRDGCHVLQNKRIISVKNKTKNKQIMEMSDVYSFGVIMFEVLCATKGTSRWLVEDHVSLADWMKSCLLHNYLVDVIDSNLKAQISPDFFRTYLHLASLCLQDQAAERPTMTDIVAILESGLEQQEAAGNKVSLHQSFSQTDSALKNSPSTGLHKSCRQFSLAELQMATNSFSPEFLIDRDGFGNIYKGKVDNETTTVSIKRYIFSSRQSKDDIWNEINMLDKLRNERIVSLIGYCIEDKEMILVLEYMAQGSLGDHIHKNTGRTDSSLLSWELRLKVCIDAARALHFLHTNRPIVIHGDFKSQNILLDENFLAKISNLCISRSASESSTHVSTVVKGTFGYLDPAYFQTGQLTFKSDVYAFGVVLMEVLCGRKAVDPSCEENERHLVVWALECIRERKFDQIVDSSLKRQILPACLKAYVEIATKCLEKDRHKRPAMDEIIRSLEFAFELQQNSGGEKEQNRAKITLCCRLFK